MSTTDAAAPDELLALGAPKSDPVDEPEPSEAKAELQNQKRSKVLPIPGRSAAIVTVHQNCWAEVEF